jgi:hypothetical protein
MISRTVALVVCLSLAAVTASSPARAAVPWLRYGEKPQGPSRLAKVAKVTGKIAKRTVAAIALPGMIVSTLGAGTLYHEIAARLLEHSSLAEPVSAAAFLFGTTLTSYFMIKGFSSYFNMR